MLKAQRVYSLVALLAACSVGAAEDCVTRAEFEALQRELAVLRSSLLPPSSASELLAPPARRFLGAADPPTSDTTTTLQLNPSEGTGAWLTAHDSSLHVAVGSSTAHVLEIKATGVDIEGNVGVGTSSPVTLKSATTLQVVGNAKLGDANDRGLLSLGDISSAGANCAIWRGAAGAYGDAGNHLNLGGYAGVTFTTGASEIAAQTERMRIDASGNIGIGTATPSAKLEVNNAASTMIDLKSDDALRLRMFGDANQAIIASEGVPLKFKYGATEAMLIDASGNVGIGTTYPRETLDLRGSAHLGTTLHHSGAFTRAPYSTFQYGSYSTLHHKLTLDAWKVLGVDTEVNVVLYRIPAKYWHQGMFDGMFGCRLQSETETRTHIQKLSFGTNCFQGTCRVNGPYYSMLQDDSCDIRVAMAGSTCEAATCDKQFIIYAHFAAHLGGSTFLFGHGTLDFSDPMVVTMEAAQTDVTSDELAGTVASTASAQRGEWDCRIYRGTSVLGLSYTAGSSRCYYERVGAMVHVHGQVQWTGTPTSNTGANLWINLPTDVWTHGRGGLAIGLINGFNFGSALSLVPEINTDPGRLYLLHDTEGENHAHVHSNDIVGTDTNYVSFGGSYRSRLDFDLV